MASTSQSPTDRKATLQKQMEALQKQMEEIDHAVIHELKLKLSDARQVVRNLEAELSKLTGEPAAAAPTKQRRPRRPTITDDAIKDQLLKVMANFGKEGMNAKQIADKMNVDPIRIRKFIKDNAGVLKKQGAGPGTKFFLP